MNHLRTGIFEYILAMVVSGAIGVFAVESHQSPTHVVFLRCAIASVSLAFYCWATGLFKSSNRIRYTQKEIALTLLGGLFVVYNWIFFFESMAMTSITLTTMVYNIQPFLVAIFGAILFKEKFTRHQAGWLIIAFIGLVLIIGLNGGGASADHLVLGISYAALAALLYALATLIAIYLKRHQPAVTVFIQMCIGTLAIYPLTSLKEIHINALEGAHLMGLGVLATFLNYVLLYSSFRKLSTSTIAILTFIYPAIAVLSDIIFYGQTLSLVQATGITIVLLASFASTQGWKFSLSQS